MGNYARNCTQSWSRESKNAYRHIFFTANTSHSAFAVGKTMETFHPDMSTYVKSCTRTRPRKSKWCRVVSWSVVVVSCPFWSLWSVFFVVCRSSWMVFIFYDGYAHVFTETYGWGKTALNVWTNVRGDNVCRWA